MLPEVARGARDGGAIVVGPFGHQGRKRARGGAVPRVRERRGIGRTFRRAQLRVAARQQAGDVEGRVLAAPLAPVDEARGQRRIARGQQRVHGQQAGVAPGRGHGQGQAQQAAPVLHHQHHVAQVQPLDQLQQHLPVPAEGVRALLLRLVAFAEADQIGRHHAVAGGGEDGDHVPPQVAPRRVAVQAQPSARGVGRAFVQVMQAQAGQRRQIADVVRHPRVAGQVVERRVGRAQRVVAQRADVHAARLEEVAQQRRRLVGQHAALHLRVVVQARFGEQVQHRAGGAGLGVGRAEHHAPHPRVQHGAGAHGAGLQRHHQRAAVEPVVAQRGRGGAQRHDLGVRARVVRADGGIAPGGDHAPVLHHHRAHRHLARGGGGAGFGQRQAHGVGIIGQHGFGHVGCFNINSCRRLMGGRWRPIWLEIARARRHRASSGTSRGCAFMAASSASLYCC